MIVTFHGDVETTSFFMTQIEEGLRADSYQVCPLFYNEDIEKWMEGKEAQLRGAFFLTFNFAGIYSKDACMVSLSDAGFNGGELSDEKSSGAEPEQTENSRQVMLVDRFMLRCINIIVDHPYHYHDFLYEQIRFRRTRYLQFCIDKQHLAYMKHYFPEIALGGFLPSGGTGYEDLISHRTGDEDIDILFPATYVEPAFFDVFINRNGPEYSAFYHSIIDEALADPKAKLEDIVKRRMEEEIEEGFTEEELRLTLGHIQFLDYTVRYQRRAEVVRALVDGSEDKERPEDGSDKNDYSLHLTILGSGWESFIQTLKHPERVTLLPYADSKEVLRLMTQSKLVLNVLPSFHEGAHDRIFNAMLCGAVCVTDSNPYLDEMLYDGGNAILYEFGQAGSGADEPLPVDKKNTVHPGVYRNGEPLAESLIRLLSPEKREEIDKMASEGYKLAARHTWIDRARLIEQAFSDFEVANDFLME